MSQQGGRLCFYITFLMFCTHKAIGISSLIALRIPEGVFLNWLHDFGWGVFRLQLPELSCDPETAWVNCASGRQPLPSQEACAFFCVLFGAKEKHRKCSSYVWHQQEVISWLYYPCSLVVGPWRGNIDFIFFIMIKHWLGKSLLSLLGSLVISVL